MAKIRYALRTDADLPVKVACTVAMVFVVVMAWTGAA